MLGEFKQCILITVDDKVIAKTIAIDFIDFLFNLTAAFTHFISEIFNNRNRRRYADTSGQKPDLLLIPI
jgi:hypothetical protein